MNAEGEWGGREETGREGVERKEEDMQQSEAFLDVNTGEGIPRQPWNSVGKKEIGGN